MKIHSTLFRAVFGLLFTVISTWSLNSCSTTNSSPAEVNETQPNLVGGWALAGETGGLSLWKDGTCRMHPDGSISSEMSREYFDGTWEQKGTVLTVSLKEECFEKKTHKLTFKSTGFYDTLADGKKYPSQVLIGDYYGAEQQMFSRVWPITKEYR